MSKSLPPLTGVNQILSSSPASRDIFKLFSLVNRVAIVTGASRGIGLEIACAYAEAGAVVYCLDKDPKPSAEFKKVDEFVNELTDLPQELLQGVPFGDGGDATVPKYKKGKLVYIHADVTDQVEMWKKVARIAEIEGRLDIAVANAGILEGFEALDYPAQNFQKIYDVNVNGVLYTAQAAGRVMKQYGTRGSLILTASMSGRVTNKDQHWVAYNSSKAAVLQMGRSLACELGEHGIRVNTVSPGYIMSKMTKQFLDHNEGLEDKWASMNPLGRIGQTAELRGVFLWLAGDGATFVNGSDVVVDGGHTAW